MPERKIKYLILLLLIPFLSSGQEMSGVVTGNYAGSNSVYLNPALMANNHVNWDLNLATVHSFVDNNYFYLPAGEATFQKVVRGEYAFPYHQKPYGDGERNVYTYYKDPSFKQGYTVNRVVGPSFMFRHKDHAFSFHVGARVVSSFHDLPYDMANFSFYGSDFYPQHNINYKHEDYSVSALAWLETGVSYATVLSRSGRDHWSAGITVNKLFANSAAYLYGGYTDYIVFNDSIMSVNEWNLEAGISLPVDYQSREVRYIDEPIRGDGWSVDLGVAYQYRERSYKKTLGSRSFRKHFEPYDFRLGVSILDLGFVKMKENAEKHLFDQVSNRYINIQDLEYDYIADEIREISEIFYGDPNASFQASSFRMWLPTAISLQADWNIHRSYYLSGMAVIPVRLSKSQVMRRPLVNATPRLETRVLGIGLPVTLYDFKYPRIGIWFRIYDLTIGSDRLGGFLPVRDFTGMDLYVSYKITFPFRAYSRFERKNPCYYNY